MMYISTIDRVTTKKLVKRNKRKDANVARTEKHRKMSTAEKANVELDGKSE